MWKTIMTVIIVNSDTKGDILCVIVCYYGVTNFRMDVTYEHAHLKS